MPNNSPIKVIALHFGWFLSGIAVLVSLPLLMGATIISEKSIWHDVVRDVGIAFLVAVIIAAIYELHVRSRFDIETMRGVLDTTLGDLVRPDIWQEVKKQIIERDTIRQNVDVRLKVEPLGPLPGPVALWMQFEYDLLGLHSTPKMCSLVHHLDNHVTYEELPEFEYIRVGEKIYKDGSGACDCVKDGTFTTDVELAARDGDPIRVVTVRKEVTYIPGSYNLTMMELTKGFSLHLMELPEGIEAAVNIRPFTNSPLPLEVNKVLDKEFRNTLLLPGQAIEFRFKPRDKVLAQPALSLAASAA